MNVPSAASLRAESVGVDFDGRTVVDGVDLQVEPGRLVVVTGQSGSGKTSLGLVLAGLLVPDRGRVYLNGRELYGSNGNADRPAYVPQNIGLVSSLTVSETVALPLKVHKLEQSEVQRRCDEWLDAVGLASCAGRLVDALSGGQRQRVAIARALAVRASALVMDEPTSELDPVRRDVVLSLLERERERGAALLAVSHEADFIALADEVFELPSRR